jgi:Kef-type K+ transport system membrane component KefB
MATISTCAVVAGSTNYRVVNAGVHVVILLTLGWLLLNSVNDAVTEATIEQLRTTVIILLVIVLALGFELYQRSEKRQ